ncbi:MAG: hypothetical protein KAH20_12540 [Methylococcales bacterium]|nr:hypothetical protein [Methylococcales bacterium]
MIKKKLDAYSIQLDKQTSFQIALAMLKDSEHIHIATGDWAYVFKSPDRNKITRITPFDPAYLHFAKLCYSNLHQNLPRILKIQPLSRSAYIVTMPNYQPGVEGDRLKFINSFKKVFSEKTLIGSGFSTLANILNVGCESGEKTIPYFAGIDWNPDNIVFENGIPIFLDAFYQEGSEITQTIKSGESTALSEDECVDFLTIPFLIHGKQQEEREI